MALEKKPFLRLLSLQFKFHSTRLHEAPPSCLHCTDGFGFGRIKVPRLPAGSSTLLLGRCLPQSRRACLGCCPWVGEVFLRRVGLGLAAEQAALPCSRKVSWGCARVCVWLLQGSRYLPWSRFSALGLANQTELPRTPDGASRRRIAVTLAGGTVPRPRGPHWFAGWQSVVSLSLGEEGGLGLFCLPGWLVFAMFPVRSS